MNEYRRIESLRKKLPELLELEELKLIASRHAEICTEAEIKCGNLIFPIYSFLFGAKKQEAPTIAFIGGVHGLERVGTNVVISFLKTICELVKWDESLAHLLSKCRLLFYPLVNPSGMYLKLRANQNGVDLMRNAPLNADLNSSAFLVGGHRISKALPWYRGHQDMPMERESQALIGFIKRECASSKFSLVLDLHSGFGLIDRLWFPFASTKRPFDHIDSIYALKSRLDRSLPNHVYIMEPQSSQYVTHGDLWDYLFFELARENPENIFLPFTLEMGSWIWVKKNPRQIFSSLGIFNPLLPHRLQRTLRRHLALLDFLMRATVSYEKWFPADKENKGNLKAKALELWYA